ncbi:MAG: FecR domain-containing protein [Longimonas sp.]|uniref:FecR family protein n=1 Tax=Longimonas sp. TaxID=2039626 RepID=UPI00335690E1
MSDRHEALVEHLLGEPSFQRWAHPEMLHNAEDDAQWRAWAQQSDAHARAVREAKRSVQAVEFSDTMQDPELVDAAWERLEQARTGASMADASTDARTAPTRAPNRRPRRTKRPSSQRHAWTWGATALVVLFAVGIVLVQQPGTIWPASQETEHTVQTAYGERATVNVSNEVVATLSGNSALTYQDDQPHQLTLRGEARFEVASRNDAQPPVEVHTPDGTVRVTGTTFTVTHWNAHTDVVLATGAVSVASHTDTSAAHTLVPGDWVTFNRSDGIQQTQKTNPQAYQSWTTDTIVFDDTPVSAIAARIERTYGYSVAVTESSVRDMKISGAVENDLDVLIEGLRGILDRPIERDAQRITIR